MESNRASSGGGGGSSSSGSGSGRSAARASGGTTTGRGGRTGRGAAGGAGGSSDNAARKGKRPARSSPGRGSSSSLRATPAGGRPTSTAGNRTGRAGGGGGGGGGAGGGNSYADLGKLVSKATKPTRETGYKRLDEDIVRRIKAIAKTDEHCAAGTIRYLMQRMTAKSAEIRYMALSIVGVLFQRSRVARKVVVTDLKNFMNLAVGHDARQPLPGPPAAAAALRQKALSLMEEWNGSHGDLYKGLRASYRFLREGKRMKFPELQAMAARERQAAARRDKHAQRLLQAKYLQAKAEIAEQAPEIETMVREMQECFAILVPAVPGADAISTGQGIGVQGSRGDTDTDDRVGGGGGGVGVGGGSGGQGGGTFSTQGSSGRGERDGGGDGGGDEGGSDDGRRGGSLSRSNSSSSIVGDGSGRSSSSRPRSSARGRTGAREAQDEGGGGGRKENERRHGEAKTRDGANGANDRGRKGDDGYRSGDSNDQDKGSATGERGGDDADSDEDEGMEWEDGGGGGGGAESDIEHRPDESEKEEEEEEEGDEDAIWRNGKRRRVEGPEGGGSDELQTIADTVEAAGLGSSGYELQVEVPMGWSVTTAGGDGDSGSGGGGDTALVVSALRERYKVMTSRLLPLLSDWIQTLGRVHFDDNDNGDNSNNNGGNTGSTTTTATTGGREGQRRHAAAAAAAPGPSASVSVSERRTCARLLGQCLSARNTANILVSKFVELRLDEEGAVGGGEGLGLAAASSSSSAAKKPRLKIRLDGAGDTAGRVGGDRR